jgi:hypothetical protein
MPPAAPIRHDFIAIDEGLNKIFRIDENRSSTEPVWHMSTGRTQVRDMQLIGGNRLLVSHNRGYSEIDLDTGEILVAVERFLGVTSARRQPDGSTLVAGVNLPNLPGVSLLELDAAHVTRRQMRYPGDYVRLIRQTPSHTLLMMCDTRLREADYLGNYLREIPVEGFAHMWKAVPLPDGRILASAGYGAFLVELDPAGRVLRKFGGRGDVPAAVNPYFYATFQLLANGHIVLANWQGHGPGHGGSGVQLVEFDAGTQIVWQWSHPAFISSLQGVLVLDGLDTGRLHDERTGPMLPL